MKKINLLMLITFCLVGCNNVTTSDSVESNDLSESESVFESESVDNSDYESSISNLLSESESVDNSDYESSISDLLSESESLSLSDSVSSVESSSESETSEEKKESKARNVTNFLSDEGEIPLINIYTNDSAEINSRETYTKGYLNIVEQPNNENTILPNTTMGIRLRGNSTLTAPKKAYRIKFDKKTSLFDLPASKSWVLLANYFDKTNLRNYLAYLTANKLDNLYFQPSSIMVEVNVNGDYQGLYLLCEQMQTGKGRVDIEDKKDENGNMSFMLELDDYGRLISDGGILNETFIEVSGKYYDIKYPEGDDLTTTQINFIKEQMTNYQVALKNKSADVDKYIDIDSFIDSYFVEELFKNVDGDYTSMFYYYEPGGKITAGPVWDFDIALDVVGLNDIDSVYNAYHNSSLWMLDRNSEYSLLATNSNYSEKFKTRYSEIKDILNSTLDEFTIAKEVLANAQNRNVDKWSIPGDLSFWISARYDNTYKSFTTLKEHYDYLENNLKKQLTAIDKKYN